MTDQADRALAGVGFALGLSAAQTQVMFDCLASQPTPETVGQAHDQLRWATDMARHTEAYPPPTDPLNWG